jgi:uncharacterized membrane protein (DUF485 family)
LSTTHQADAAPPPPATPSREAFVEMQSDPDFQDLRRRLRRFVFPMTGIFLAWYLLYVLLADYAHDFMGTRLGGSNITVGLVFGLLQFVSTFLIAGLYVRFANRDFDPRAAALRERLEGGAR